MADMGRPTLYNEELATKVCEEIALGKSLRTVCKADDMPAVRTLFNWFEKYPNFLQQYMRAKEAAADALADDIQEIGEGVLKGVYEANNARVAIDAKKWVASKLKPKRYGDKLDLTSDGEKLNPYSSLTVEELKKLAEDIS